MSLKYTPATLRKLEHLLEEAAYTVRYEKGNFQSGCCVLEDRRIVVVNKFLPVEGRIHALLEMLPAIGLAPEALPSEFARWYQKPAAAPVSPHPSEDDLRS